jgi:hypothetical protein
MDNLEILSNMLEVLIFLPKKKPFTCKKHKTKSQIAITLIYVFFSLRAKTRRNVALKSKKG